MQKEVYKIDKSHKAQVRNNNPIPSMYGIFTYIWLIYMVHVGKYTIHGCCGNRFFELFVISQGFVGSVVLQTR